MPGAWALAAIRIIAVYKFVRKLPPRTAFRITFSVRWFAD